MNTNTVIAVVLLVIAVLGLLLSTVILSSIAVGGGIVHGIHMSKVK